MELEGYLRFVAALALVLGLIGVIAWGARKLGLAGRLPMVAGRGRRLGVVEATSLDTKHRLVLVRRDDVEHLLLLGPAGAVVVEGGIAAPPARGRSRRRQRRPQAKPQRGRPMIRRFSLAALIAAGLAVLVAPVPALAQSLALDLGDGGSFTGRIVQLLALITILSLAPSILVVVTSFTRIVVVLSIIRSALGLQQTPPNAVLISLALFLTAFIMAPTLEISYREGIAPLIAEQITEEEAFERTLAPVHGFMMNHVRQKRTWRCSWASPRRRRPTAPPRRRSGSWCRRS